MNHWRIALYWLTLTSARAVEPHVEAAKVEIIPLAVHHQRSLGQIARHSLAAWKKETNRVNR